MGIYEGETIYGQGGMIYEGETIYRGRHYLRGGRLSVGGGENIYGGGGGGGG